MSLLETVITSTNDTPPKVILYGLPGVGKTTFAASASAILIDCENGAGNIQGLRRTPYLSTWPAMDAWLTELAQADGLPAVAVDTIDWMVQRIIEHVTIDMSHGKALTNTLGSSHGGYFKAREIVQNIIYRDVLPKLNAIASRGTAIILLAHADNEKFTTPEGANYRIASPDLPAWIRPAFIEWADAVLYARQSDTGERIVRTVGTNTVLAKNRYSLPPEIPLSWPALIAGLTKNSTPSQEK